MRPCVLALALVAASAIIVPPVYGWKPSTHVYLALRALDEITGDVDLLGNPKLPGEVVFYRVNHATGQVLERIGAYQADAALVNALTNHRRAFVMGVLGPDAYPDIATGQQRIHVRHPVHSDRWLRYLWDQGQGKDPMIRAFVAGYLTHAIGDMFMHTYVNHYAGGEFSVDVENASGHPLNFNAARHVIFESYIGKRGQDLAPADFDIGPRIQEPLREFLYRHLADARTLEHPALAPRSDTYFGRAVLARKPYLSGGDFESSVPRFFSDLRDGLVGYLNMVDDTVAAIDSRINRFFEDAARQSCPVNVRCDSPLGQQTPACVTACTFAAGLASPHVAAKLAFQTANAGPYTYVMQEWVPNIDSGLRKWLDLNHQIARLVLFSSDEAAGGSSKLTAAKDSISTFADVVLPGMLGLPSVVGEYVAFSNAVKEMIFGDIQDALDDMRSNLASFLFESAFGMSIDEFQEAYVSPQVLFNNVMPLSYASSDGLVGKSVTLSTLNHDLGINDPGFTAPQLRWSIADLPPAWNTLTLTKLSLLSRAGLIALMEDLGVECPNGACLTDENVALGFMRSLDESLQWLPDDPTRPLDDPAYALYKDALPGFAFEQCAVYAQLFMQQHGDESDAYVADGHVIEARPCAPMVALGAPVVTPPGGTFGAPVLVSIEPPPVLSPAERDALEIYYTLQIAGNTVEPEKPRSGAVDSRVHVYNGPFQVTPPLDPAQLPITVRAKAYHPGYLPSATVVLPFDVDARLATPIFSRTPGEYLEPFSVTLTLPNNPGGSAIFYTTSGEDPDYNDTPYTGPIALARGAHELRAVAYRPGYVRSDFATAEYRIYAPGEVERAEAPYFTSPRGSGTYTGTVTVALETDTQDGVIRWAAGLDQLPPNDPTATLGNAYTGPFNLPKGNWFIRAITVKDGLFDSPIAQINLNIVDPLGTTSEPVISPPGGVFHNPVQVRLASAVTFVNNQGQTVTDSSGMQIQYTLDGTDPDINTAFNPASNRRYQQPFTLNRSSRLRALAYRVFFPITEVAEATFTFVAAPPAFSVASGVYYDSVRVAIASETQNAIIRYTLDGTEPDETSIQYTQPILFTSSASLRARAFRNGYSFSDVSDAAFVVESRVPAAIVRQPRRVEVVVGATAELTVRAAGQPTPSLQWYLEGALIDGAVDDTLRIEDVDEGHAGIYTVRLSNGTADVLSEPAELIVLPEAVAPEIVADLPDVLEVASGEAITFGIDATGAPAPAYHWFRNGQPLNGQSASSIAYGTADLAQAGTYQVVASNVAGTDTSRAMQLVILLAANVAAEASEELPQQFELGQNYPNPFNPSTSIPFAVPEQARVRLTIYDVAGRRIAVLVDRDFGPGRYTARFEAAELASGIYLYRIEAGTWSEVRKLVLVR